MKFFSKFKNSIISQTVILAIVFGFAAGVVGQLVSDVYINPFEDELLRQELLLNQGIGPIIPELRRVSKFLGIEQDFQVDQAINQIQPSLAGIYPAKSGQDVSYQPNDHVGNAFILTSDGWLATSADVSGTMLIIHQGNKYLIEQVVPDTSSGVTFIKINAQNLPVVALGDSNSATLGQLAVALNSLGHARVTTIQSLSTLVGSAASNLLESSEVYSKQLTVVDSVDTFFTGGPLINLGGEVIGIIVKNGNSIPINQFREVFLTVLRSGVTKRPFLGATYFDLSRSVSHENSNRDGAQIAATPAFRTPAAQAGLRLGDIIINVEQERITNKISLVDLIQQYQPGDEVSLEVLRGDERLSLSVNLGLFEE